MFPFQRFLPAALAAFGLLVVTTQPAHAGPIWVEVEMHSPLPSYETPGAVAVALQIAISVEPGWYFAGMSFTGLGDGAGHTFFFDSVIMSRPLWNQLEELSFSPYGGGALGYYGASDIDAQTPPGLYDRDPRNPGSPASLTVYATNDQGETASDSVWVRFRVPGLPAPPRVPAVPEPASALLLSLGLMIPAGVWLRRRRAG